MKDDDDVVLFDSRQPVINFCRSSNATRLGNLLSGVTAGVDEHLNSIVVVELERSFTYSNVGGDNTTARDYLDILDANIELLYAPQLVKRVAFLPFFIGEDTPMVTVPIPNDFSQSDTQKSFVFSLSFASSGKVYSTDDYATATIIPNSNQVRLYSLREFSSAQLRGYVQIAMFAQNDAVSTPLELDEFSNGKYNAPIAGDNAITLVQTACSSLAVSVQFHECNNVTLSLNTPSKFVDKGSVESVAIINAISFGSKSDDILATISAKVSVSAMTTVSVRVVPLESIVPINEDIFPYIVQFRTVLTSDYNDFRQTPVVAFVSASLFGADEVHLAVRREAPYASQSFDAYIEIMILRKSSDESTSTPVATTQKFTNNDGNSISATNSISSTNALSKINSLSTNNSISTNNSTLMRNSASVSSSVSTTKFDDQDQDPNQNQNAPVGVDGEEKDSQLVLIIGILCGLAVVVSLLIAIVVFRKRKSKSRQSTSQESPAQSANSQYGSIGLSAIQSSNYDSGNVHQFSNDNNNNKNSNEYAVGNISM